MISGGWINFAACIALVGYGAAAASAQDYYGSSFSTQISAAPSGADPTPESEDYRELLHRLELAEQKIQVLTEGQAELRRLPAVAGADATVAATTQTPVEKALAKAADAGPKFPTVKLTGFFHLDAGYFHQDAASFATLGDIQDGVGFRRARLQAVGSVAEFTNYSIEMDFATPGRPSFMDVWGEQTHVPVFGNVRIGHFRQPFSMDSLTSIRQLQFLERSLPFQAFVPFRRVGVMAYDKSENELWTWAYGVYRTGGFNNAPLGDSRFATDIGDNGGASFSGRATHLLWYDEPAEGRYLLHVGGSYNYSRITGGTANGNSYEARVIPEFFVGDPAGGGLTANGTPFFADTGRLAADQFNLYGVELAGQYGPAHFQAEYMATSVDQLVGPSVFYDGAYVQAGYFLTGEHRTYNKMFGTLDRVTPFTEFFGLGRDSYICGWGAWEVTGRWSYVNLNDPGAIPTAFAAGPPPTPNPGRMNDLTFGINWYWNAYAKLQFNYIHAFLDNAALGDSDTDIFAGRFQVEF